MSDNQRVADAELPQAGSDDPRLIGGLARLSQAPFALAMARPVECDHPVARGERIPQAEHGFGEVGGGAVKQHDGVSGVAVGRGSP